MNLCDDQHEEICFEQRVCPLCEKIKEIENLEKKIDELKQEISEIKNL